MNSIIISLFLCWSSLTVNEEVREHTNILTKEQQNIYEIYRSIEHSDILPDFEIFYQGLMGYYQLSEKEVLKKENYLTLIDFTASSNEKRLWVIDLHSRKVLFHELVAHGRKTGNEYARSFSNITGSNQSSLGFYLTAEPYYGKHGLSLRLDGLEPGINDKARERAIVIHGAEYVNEKFIRTYGRLGRSLGCPAVSTTVNRNLISTIKEGSCLFIYYPEDNYLTRSALINKPKTDFISDLY